MYYNMRIKTLRRTCRALMRRAREGLVLKTDPLAKSIDAMHREVRRVRCGGMAITASHDSSVA